MRFLSVSLPVPSVSQEFPEPFPNSFPSVSWTFPKLCQAFPERFLSVALAFPPRFPCVPSGPMGPLGRLCIDLWFVGHVASHTCCTSLSVLKSETLGPLPCAVTQQPHPSVTSGSQSSRTPRYIWGSPRTAPPSARKAAL